MSVIRTTSTSRQTADVDPIVLRETTTTRLIFRAVLIDNRADPGAPVDGVFVFQRKGRKDEWGDVSSVPLSTLKAGEGVKLELKAAELKRLFDGVGDYYTLVKEHGVRSGVREFVRAPETKWLLDLVANEKEFRSVLQDDEVSGSLLHGLIGWIAENELAVAAARLDGISLEELQQFDAVLGLARLQRFCRLLDDNMTNADEDFWQAELEKNGWAIAQVFAIPTMLLESQVYVGGKRIHNKGGNTADFLYENDITGNLVVVEIKTPVTDLVGKEYRNNVYPPSEEASGGLAQISHNRMSLSESYRDLATNTMKSQQSLSSRGLLIIGNAANMTEIQLKGFEIWRNQQKDIDIVTFDEVRRKVGLMVSLLENAAEL